MAEHDLEFPTAMLLYDESGMSDDRHVRVGHNEFMADTFDLLQLANIVEELRSVSQFSSYRIVDLLWFISYDIFLNSRQNYDGSSTSRD